MPHRAREQRCDALVWINPRTSATRIAYDFHRSTGIVFAITLLLATLTGATLVYVNYVRDLVSVFSKVAPFPTVPWQTQKRCTSRCSLIA